MHLVYLQNFGITIVFDFSWDDCNTQEKLKTMVMYFFWWGGGWGGRGNNMHYGLGKNGKYIFCIR